MPQGPSQAQPLCLGVFPSCFNTFHQKWSKSQFLPFYTLLYPRKKVTLKHNTPTTTLATVYWSAAIIIVNDRYSNKMPLRNWPFGHGDLSRHLPIQTYTKQWVSPKADNYNVLLELEQSNTSKNMSFSYCINHVMNRKLL